MNDACFLEPQQKAVEFPLDKDLMAAVAKTLGCIPDEEHPAPAIHRHTQTQISLAVAYACLLADEADGVTPSHIKLLSKEFSKIEIDALTSYIFSLLGKNVREHLEEEDVVF